MDTDLHGIGAVSRASGLSVSALRFYDREGVLTPAVVDAVTGYRRYRPDQVHQARLLAGMRRVGMPPAEMSVVLEQADDPDVTGDLLDAHLARLEDGLADARRELAHVRRLLQGDAPAWQVRLDAEDLLRCLAAVRHAVGTDPGYPALGGVLLEIEDDVLRMVATDRYRLAVSEATLRDGAVGTGAALVPASLLDELAGAAPVDEITLERAGGQVVLAGEGFRVCGDVLDHDFPDYRRLLDARPGVSHLVETDRLRRDATTAANLHHVPDLDDPEVVRLVPADATLLAHDSAGGTEDTMALNREFLLQALDGLDAGQLALELDGPIQPLALRSVDTPGTFCLLMPVRAP